MSIFSDIGFLISNFPQIEACFEQGEQAVKDGTATYNDLMTFAAQAMTLYRSFQAARQPPTPIMQSPTPSAPSVTADDLNAQELQQIEALTKSQAWSR